MTGPVGLFDSGVGGLTVLRAVRRFVPGLPLLYVGDTARVPWGTKGAPTVRRYAVEIATELERRGCSSIVIACHTASTLAVDAVRAAVSVPVIDVVEPVAQALGADSGVRRVLVLGTRGTVTGGAYPTRIRAARGDIEVRQMACPLFVPLAEEGWVDGDVPERVARHYLEPVVRDWSPDAVVLGCTHYPLLHDAIDRTLKTLVAEPVRIVESGPATAAALRDARSSATDLNPDAPGQAPRYLVTDDPERFCALGTRFLGEPVEAAELLPLTELEAGVPRQG